MRTEYIEHKEPLVLSNDGGTNLHLNNDECKDMIIFDVKNIDTAYCKNGKGYIVLNRKGRYQQKVEEPKELTKEEKKTREILDTINQALFDCILSEDEQYQMNARSYAAQMITEYPYDN